MEHKQKTAYLVWDIMQSQKDPCFIVQNEGKNIVFIQKHNDIFPTYTRQTTLKKWGTRLKHKKYV